MNADATMSDRATRATIAQLTLTLRAAERDAEAAEVAEEGWELDLALAQLRTRMTPLVEQRRRLLDEELALEHLKAAEARAAAEAEAVGIIESARAAHAAAADAFADVPLTIDLDGDIVAWDEPVPAEDHAAAPLDDAAEPNPDDDSAESDDDDALVDDAFGTLVTLDDHDDSGLPAPVGAPVVFPPPHTTEARITVTLDPDAFARAFAAAFGAMMDERLASMQMAPPQQAQWAQVPATPPARRSFWANAWHADVILSLVAALIVVVILIAWST